MEELKNARLPEDFLEGIAEKLPSRTNKITEKTNSKSDIIERASLQEDGNSLLFIIHLITINKIKIPDYAYILYIPLAIRKRNYKCQNLTKLNYVF